MCGKAVIELMSDLCAGSGYSYAGIVDSDVYYDEFGIPLIPARRLKGCMREAAEIFCSETEIYKMFGKAGDSEAKGFTMGNAYIADYSLLTEELQKLKKNNKRVFEYLTPQNILELYTNVRAQTEINPATGVAEDTSLRYTRVVGKNDPLSEGERLCFFADIEYEEENEEEQKTYKLLTNILKATRNIGLKRNRGLGSVRCHLTDVKRADDIGGESGAFAGEGKVCLTYVLKNDAPLMLSSINEGVSDTYISGKSILGKMAGAYLNNEGKTADSEEFRKLFLDGSTIFSNAYITMQREDGKTDEKVWGRYVPAPNYLNRLKKSKKLINTMKLQEADEISGREDKGDIPKKLKTHYVCETSENEYHVIEAEKEVIYHHSRVGETLYAHEALKERQYFKGYIYTDCEYASLLADLLKKTSLRFGKSKNVQYGYCSLEELLIEEPEEQRIEIEAGGQLAVTFCSDALFTNEYGYTVQFDEVKQQIAKELKLNEQEISWGERDELSSIQTAEITGYHTKWNLKRQSMPAIKAGSTFVYQIDEVKGNTVLSLPKFVGERNLEGFGEVHFSKCQKMKCLVEEYTDMKIRETKKVSENAEEIKPEKCKALLERILSKKILNQLIYDYISENTGHIRINSSLIGRVTLMLKESLNENKEDIKKALKEFYVRIDSIKRVNEGKEVSKLLETMQLNRGKLSPAMSKLLETAERYGEIDCDKLITDLKGDYFMTVLAYCKYKAKQEGVNKSHE